MLAPITTLATHGGPTAAPPIGLPAVAGPVVTLAFTLPLAGPVPSVIQPPVPQSCQNSSPNVALQVLVVDQAGAAVDVSEATGLQLWLLAPDGTPQPVQAAFVSNGLDGLIQHVVSAGELVEAGLWSVQAQLTFDTQVLLTRWGVFGVDANVADL